MDCMGVKRPSLWYFVLKETGTNFATNKDKMGILPITSHSGITHFASVQSKRINSYGFDYDKAKGKLISFHVDIVLFLRNKSFSTTLTMARKTLVKKIEREKTTRKYA